MTPLEVVELGLLGLLGGLVGGLAGIGGSIVLLPGLHLVLAPEAASTHHVFMAAAMMVNFFVATPSAISHHRAGAVRVGLLKRLAAGTLCGVVAGVLLSNLLDGEALKALLAVVILLYAGRNVHLLVRPRRRGFSGQGRVERTGTGRLLGVGVATGVFSGLLGIGGGVVLVPLLQLVCNVKLRNAIATSSAVICITAAVGATLKVSSLGSLGLPAGGALLLAATLAPTAMLGGWFGAKLTHALPREAVRAALVVLLAAIASRMLGVWGEGGSGAAPSDVEVSEH